MFSDMTRKITSGEIQSIIDVYESDIQSSKNTIALAKNQDEDDEQWIKKHREHSAKYAQQTIIERQKRINALKMELGKL